MTEPWIITCETCQSKLRVRSAAAVGAILSCPKCQSLVHVAPPEVSAESLPSEPEHSESKRVETTEPAGGRAASTKFALAGGGIVVAVAIGLFVAYSSGQRSVTAAADLPPEGEVESGGTEATEAEEESSAAPGVSRSEEPSDRGPRAEAATSSEDRSQDAPAADAPPPLPELTGGLDRAKPLRKGPATGGRGRPEIPPVGLEQFDLSFDSGEPISVAAPRPSPSLAEGTRTDAGNPAADEARAEPPASSNVRMAIERLDAGATLPPPLDPGQALSLPLTDVATAASDAPSPLSLVRLIAEMTGAQITFKPEAYVAARESSLTGRSVQYSHVTAGEALRDILQQYGLRVNENGPYLVVVPAEDTTQPRSRQRPSEKVADRPPLAAKLRQQVTFSFTRGTALSSVLRHIERTAGLTLLVDWESLASVGLGPATPVTVSVVDQPLEDVLNGLLPQLDMTWDAIGDDALWLTGSPGS